MVNAAEARVQAVTSELWVEPGTQEVQKAYQRTLLASNKYHEMLKMNSMGGSAGPGDFKRQGEELVSAANALQAMIVDQLAKLESPLTGA